MRAFAGRAVLVTGGAGFVGGALARRLAALGARVTVLDDLSTGSPADVPAGARLVHGSVADHETVRPLVAEHPVVFHLAARGIVASTGEPRRDFESNVLGTLNVLLAAREFGVERLVYASSSSIYGNPRTLPVGEEGTPLALSPYAASKAGAEQYCFAFHESYGVPAAVLRYSNVYGPGQRPENRYAGVAAKFLARAAAGRPLPIHGDGRQTRDFTFVDDVVQATLLAAASPHAVGEAFNVGTGVETSVLELARAIGEALGVDVEAEHVDRRDVDNIRRRVLDIDKIRRLLGWSPQVGLEEGLRRTAAASRAALDGASVRT